jgi:hypothetical protein
MDKTYIDGLKELFGDMSSMTPEKLQSFMKHTMDHLIGLRQKLSSKDPQDREEAMNAALELKGVLEGQMADLGKVIGIDPSKLSETDLMERMNENDQNLMVSAKAQFNELKSSSMPAKRHSKKKEKIKLIG